MRRCENNIKMGREEVCQIKLYHDSVQWRIIMNLIMKLQAL